MARNPEAKYLNVELTREQYRQLQAVTTADDVFMMHYIRDVLVTELDRRCKALDGPPPPTEPPRRPTPAAPAKPAPPAEPAKPKRPAPRPSTSTPDRPAA